MSLLIPAAFAFGIIIPIILLFYFMRPKRQERVVSSTLLWQQALQDLRASHPWQRLRITPLLLLQLLAAVVIILVLARPAIFIPSPIGNNTIIVLQASASMQATDVSPDRFEAAKSRIADLIDGLAPGARLSIITMARTPQVIASSSDKSLLTTALQRASVTNEDADLEQALSLATSLAAGQQDTQILVVGDGHVLPLDQPLVVPFPVYYLQIGSDAPNAALLALAARTIEGRLVALAQVANYSHQQRSLPVELYADGKLVGVQTAILAAGASGAIEWGPLPPTTHVLHARLISQDAMTVDHEAWAVAGESTPGRVLLVTRGNTFLETALRLQKNITLYETTPDQYTGAGNFDLTVFDGFVPAQLPASDILFVNPPAGTSIFGKSGPEVPINHISAGSDDQDLLTNVDLSSIHVLRASHQLTPASWMQTVITASQTPLLIAGENDNRRIAALGFDLHDSDLPLQPGFPILVYNLVNWFLPPPVPGNGQVAPGTPVTIQAWPGAQRITITAPGQQPVTVAPPFPPVPFNQTDKTGIYYVTQATGNQQRQGAFSVNLFDPAQSDLAPADQLPILHSQSFNAGGTGVPHVLREIWPWIAALLLLILCTEWWLFSRSYSSGGALNIAPEQKQMTHRGGGSERWWERLLRSPYYKALRKRSSRVTKRLKSRPKAKGKRHANI